MSAKSALTEKQQAFVDAYRGEANGNVTEAARIAGYGHPKQTGYQIVKTKAVAAALSNHATEQPEEGQYIDEIATILSEADMAAPPDLHRRVLWLEACIAALDDRIAQLERLVGTP